MSSKTMTSGKKRKPSRPAARRGRGNPSRETLMAVGKWRAKVSAKSSGPHRADMRRKVMTRGVKTIDVLDLFEEAKLLLRQGYEVRLASENDGEAIRLYPCLDANYAQMFVAAMTMGGFRQSVGDIPFCMVHCGETVDLEEERVAKERKAETIRRQSRQNVSPDTVVTCPKCGTEFRVGKVLG